MRRARSGTCPVSISSAISSPVAGLMHTPSPPKRAATYTFCPVRGSFSTLPCCLTEFPLSDIVKTQFVLPICFRSRWCRELLRSAIRSNWVEDLTRRTRAATFLSVQLLTSCSTSETPIRTARSIPTLSITALMSLVRSSRSGADSVGSDNPCPRLSNVTT